MSDLVVVVPTRVRPHSVAPLLAAFGATCRAKTTVVFALDGDPAPQLYEAAVADAGDLSGNVSVYLQQGPRRRMVATLNHTVAVVLSTLDTRAVAYLGDDHRPATVGWDETFLTTLDHLGIGLCYGDDGHQGENLPTAVAMSAEIPTALGYMVPPELVHMYVDNYWLDLGRGAAAITYLPQVKLIHHHPGTAQATDWDASYHDSNSAQRYEADRLAYEALKTSGRVAADITTLTKLRWQRKYGSPS